MFKDLIILWKIVMLKVIYKILQIRYIRKYTRKFLFEDHCQVCMNLGLRFLKISIKVHNRSNCIIFNLILFVKQKILLNSINGFSLIHRREKFQEDYRNKMIHDVTNIKLINPIPSNIA